MKRVLRSRLRRKVIVTLKTGDAFQGLLFEADRQALVLREAVGVGAGPAGAHVGVDGELLILLADVAYLQIP
jgi:small nuclear ribonucleoprotein (snRNP)-like protein